MNTSGSAPIDQFLAAVAARQPTPGGGAVAALVGATAAAIGEMVLNYSVGKKGGTPEADTRLSAVVHEWERARAMMLELMVEDQQAFAAFTAAKKLPDSDAGKSKAVADAAEACIAVPRAIAATALAILEKADAVAGMANKFLLSDLSVCVELAMATLRCAVHCVRVNLPDQPEAKRDAIAAECEAELQRGIRLIRRTSGAISSVA